MMNWSGGIRVALQLSIVSISLFQSTINRQSELFRAYEGALLSVPWMLSFCLTVWFCTFLFLTFGLSDLLLVGLLLLTAITCVIGHAAGPATDAIVLLAGV